jgi:hypothetical protein
MSWPPITTSRRSRAGSGSTSCCEAFLSRRPPGDFSARRRHPVYDLYYAVLARREDAAILTFDGRLKQLCIEMHVPLADA